MKEIVTGDCLEKIYLVMEYCEHELRELMENNREKFGEKEIKTIIYGLLKGMEFIITNSPRFHLLDTLLVKKLVFSKMVKETDFGFVTIAMVNCGIRVITRMAKKKVIGYIIMIMDNYGIKNLLKMEK